MTDKSHLLRFGYAPGNYWFVCPDCGDKQAVGDKRATRCEACAESLHAQITSVEAVADKHRAMTTLPEEAVKAAQNELSRIISEWERNREFLNVSPEAKKNFMRRQASALSALEPSAARELALEQAAHECEKRGAVTSADAIRALSSPDHADAGKVEGDGWLPIESAPKDGSVILVYREDAGVFTAHYVEEDAHLSSPMNPPEGDFYWFSTAGDDLTNDMPTYWRSLPLAPASEGTSNV